MMADLVKTSELSGADQLGAILSLVLERGEIKSAKTKKRAMQFLDELKREGSELAASLKDYPALTFSA